MHEHSCLAVTPAPRRPTRLSRRPRRIPQLDDETLEALLLLRLTFLKRLPALGRTTRS